MQSGCMQRCSEYPNSRPRINTRDLQESRLRTTLQRHWPAAPLGQRSLHRKAGLCTHYNVQRSCHCTARCSCVLGDGNLRSLDVKTVVSSSSLVLRTGHVHADPQFTTLRLSTTLVTKKATTPWLQCNMCYRMFSEEVQVLPSAHS